MCINKPRMKATDNVALEFLQGFSMTGWAWFFFSPYCSYAVFAQAIYCSHY